MSENVLAKLTSRKWLREAISGRVSDLINSFTFEPSVIDREVAGEPYRFFIGNVTGKSWYSSSSDPSYEMSFVRDNLMSSGAIVIECGAHHGAQTILLSRWAGSQGKVIVVEPIPENIAILKRNIELNGLTNVIVVEKAAGSSGGYLSMAPNSNGSVRRQGKNTIQVESITLDQLAADLRITPTFLKIDVEGYEYQVLEGARSILSTTPAIFVEVHTLSLDRYGKNFDDLWKMIDYDRYDLFVQAEDFEKPKQSSPGAIPGERVHLFFKPRG